MIAHHQLQSLRAVCARDGSLLSGKLSAPFTGDGWVMASNGWAALAILVLIVLALWMGWHS